MRLPRLRLRSLRNRLALLFVAVTALALAVVIFFFLPQLHAKLEAQKLRDLANVAASTSLRLQGVIGRNVTNPQVDRLVRRTADSASARVTLVGLQRSTGPEPAPYYVISDSAESSGVAPNLRLIGAAAVARRDGALISFETGDTGQVARPLLYGGRPVSVAIYTRRFDDAARVVALVRGRLLVASAVALLVAAIGGYLVARALSRRVRRIDDAAQALAAGRQVGPLPVDSDDELGRLTRTFNEMQEQLQRAERARREFIANASHELRTPIFSLGGFVELLQDEQLDAATRDEFLQTMREQVDRLGKLAVDLLDLSRLDAGSLELNTDSVDLAELADTIAAEFRPVVAAHGTALAVRSARRPVAALCDRQRMAQIMRILLDNALRHTPEGTSVIVSTDRQNGTAEFAVTDRGPGVEAATRGQLFERFYTGDAARGSGLGLAIAKELAERMDGHISLQSRPGKTVFTVVLPVAHEDGAP
ncbi:MAG: hypothetical protein NVSMB25_00310 [Thermoleophilaceae bacterium]